MSVYLDISINGKEVGRLEIELYSDDCPKTAENFRSLCTGDRGKSFSGRTFHRLIPNFMIQGGCDRGDGTGGSSIYGKAFSDERPGLLKQHNRRGLLSMANSGANTNGSQFFILFREAPHLNGRHVVFGCIVSGWNVLTVLEKVSTGTNDKPRTQVIIKRCGEVVRDTYTPSPKMKLSQINVSDDLKVQNEHQNNTLSSSSSSSTKNLKIGVGEASTVDVYVNHENNGVNSTIGMTDMQRRLFNVRMKMNLGRKANKYESEKEFQMVHRKRKNITNVDSNDNQQCSRKSDNLERVHDVGVDEKFMLESAKYIQYDLNRKEGKSRNYCTSDIKYSAYENDLKRLESSVNINGKDEIKDSGDADLYHDHIPIGQTKRGVEQLSIDVINQENKRKMSKLRIKDGGNISFINKRNEKHNRQINQVFDKDTVEIRQNLERGTAV
jgi:cyclophilin family peptidyl-prolyl cis-trans isomerase